MQFLEGRGKLSAQNAASWKIVVDSWGKTMPLKEQVALINRLTFLNFKVCSPLTYFGFSMPTAALLFTKHDWQAFCAQCSSKDANANPTEGTSKPSFCADKVQQVLVFCPP